MNNSFPVAVRLRGGESLIGTMLRFSRNPAVATIAKNAGFDFVMLDMEHGAYGFETMSDIACVARAEGLGLMVRVPELSRNFVCRALDCGANGIMVPMLESAEQAEQLVNWMRYPSAGGRGLSSSGSHTGYHKPSNVSQFLREQNESTFAIAQIETVTGVENSRRIAEVPGIDALVVGPNDLAVSLGKPGGLESNEVDEAIAKIASGALSAGKVFGVHVGTALLERWSKLGITFYMNDIDDNILSEGLRRVHSETVSIIKAMRDGRPESV